MTFLKHADPRIGIIGLGYVGLPLAIEFGKIYKTMAFDINSDRIAELERGLDRTLETSFQDLKSAKKLSFVNKVTKLARSNTYIITVPTPIDNSKKPDFTPLKKASELVATVLEENDIVIYESTVYPGATEEICVPILESGSGLKFNKEFSVGYSPERINPGDKEHRLGDIIKVTSGSNKATAEYVDNLYKSIIKAGTHKVSSIKAAEAAKIIENTQRDLNIALINELALIFNRLGIDTLEVLEAAETKWNFISFRPGLVGGHCIGVDPYYLTHKAEAIGYRPEVILSGRKLNDSMGTYVARQVVKCMSRKRVSLNNAKVLILGLSFKENCPDLRNTKIIDIIAELTEFGLSVDVHDPWVLASDANTEYGLDLINNPKLGTYSVIILAVAHKIFIDKGSKNIRKYGLEEHVFFDLKSVFCLEESDLRL